MRFEDLQNSLLYAATRRIDTEGYIWWNPLIAGYGWRTKGATLRYGLLSTITRNPDWASVPGV